MLEGAFTQQAERCFLASTADDFKGVIEKVRTERPQDYLKIVASVMPKRMEVEDVGPPCRAGSIR